MITSIVILLLSMTVHGQLWNYDDDFNAIWTAETPECGYPRQSPIDITIDANSSCDNDKVFEIDMVKSISSKWKVFNDRQSLKAVPFMFDDSDPSRPVISYYDNTTSMRLKNAFYNTYQSHTNKEYCLDSLHFHWGATDDEGSEHTVNGEMYPLEVHLVHYSCDYKTIVPALTAYASGAADTMYDDENVLAVVGVFFEIGDENPVIDAMLTDDIFDNIITYDANPENGNEYKLFHTEFNIDGLLPESNQAIAYLGSLTTPPCFETVRWHVMKETLTVSPGQMAKFRALSQSTNPVDTMAPNYRPPQPLNDRKVYQCQADVAEDVLGDKSGLNDGENGEVERWRDIAMVFISAFSVSIIGCLICVFYCYKQKRVKIEDELVESQKVDANKELNKELNTGSYEAC